MFEPSAVTRNNPVLAFSFYGIGMPELIILAIIVLLLFGNRLPSVMRSLGQSITEFKKGAREGAQESDEGSHKSG